MAKKMIRSLRSEADYDAAWRLHREWGIPAEALIAPPRMCGRKSAA